MSRIWQVHHRPLALIASGGLLILLSIPVPEHPLEDVQLLDKWTHFVLFCGLGWVYLNTALRRSPTSLRRALLGGWGAAVLMGLGSEGLQLLLPWRSGEWLDALANAIGATLALATFLFFQLRNPSPSKLS